MTMLVGHQSGYLPPYLVLNCDRFGSCLWGMFRE